MPQQLACGYSSLLMAGRYVNNAQDIEAVATQDCKEGRLHNVASLDPWYNHS
jgi:hypothetical protein